MSEGLCQLMSMDMKPDLRYCPISSSFIFLQLGPIQALERPSLRSICHADLGFMTLFVRVYNPMVFLKENFLLQII